MHTEILGNEARNSLEILKKSDIIKTFYLAGGTGLALHFGHRISEDLDFFTQTVFDPKRLASEVSKKGKFTVTGQESGTLHGVFEGAKLSFLYYPYRMLRELKRDGNFSLADTLDIGCMKIDTIASRGKKKDFIDLYFLMQQYSLQELLHAYEEKYADVKYDMMHIMKSLTYFDDAQGDPEITFLNQKVSWERAKRDIIMQVRKLQ